MRLLVLGDPDTSVIDSLKYLHAPHTGISEHLSFHGFAETCRQSNFVGFQRFGKTYPTTSNILIALEHSSRTLDCWAQIDQAKSWRTAITPKLVI